MVSISSCSLRTLCGSCFRATWLMLAPLIAVTASLFVWTGFWNIITSYSEGEVIAYDFLYASVGFILVAFTGTFLAQAGVQPVRYEPRLSPKDYEYTSPLINRPSASTSQYIPVIDKLLSLLSTDESKHDQTRATTISTEPAPSLSSASLRDKVAVHIRATVAMFAGILLWLGVYNILDLYVFADPDFLVARHIIYICTGIFLMIISGTFISESDLTVLEISVITSRSSMVLYYFKALVGLAGSIIYWVGAYNTVDAHFGESSKFRDALYIVFGFFSLIATQLLGRLVVYLHKQNADAKEHQFSSENFQLPVSETGNHISSISSLKSPLVRAIIAFRILLSMVAGVFYWVGWWNILSYYIIESSDDEDEGDMSVTQDSGTALAHSFRLYTFHLLNETDDDDHSSQFPIYALYIIFTFGGLFILVCTGGLLGSGGVLQPVAFTRANVRKPGVAALRHGEGYDQNSTTVELIMDGDTFIPPTGFEKE